MMKCENCKTELKDSDVIGWKCLECGKEFKVHYSKLKGLGMKKSQVENKDKALLQCPSCGKELDNGNEQLLCKCGSCGNLIKGNLKFFVPDKSVKTTGNDNSETLSYSSRLTQCPKCGKQISLRARSCVHCGKVLIKESTEGVCEDCGKSIPANAKVCPYCGCPVEESVTQGTNNKMVSKNIFKIVVPICITILVIGIGIIIIGKGVSWYLNDKYDDADTKTRDVIFDNATETITVGDTMEADEKYLLDDTLTALTEDKWINVDNGDEYLLARDGTGKHGDMTLTYTLDENNVAIVEGVSSVQAKNFVWDRDNSIPRLVPENENTYYVRERDYDEISKLVTEENIKILVSQEFWKASTELAYMQFLEDGSGWVIMVGTTLAMTWEMVDNNTVKSHVDYGYEGGQDVELDIINDNGNYQLIAGNGTYYTPHSN